MKRTISIIIAVMLIMTSMLAFAACGEGNLRKSPMPENIVVKNGRLEWDFPTIENWISWPKVTVTCNGHSVESGANAKSVSLDGIITETGTYTFTLESKSGWLDGVAYENVTTTATFNISKLPAPLNLDYNASTKKLTWNPVSKATGYTVMIANKTHEVSTAEFILDDASGVQSITVVAKGNGAEIFDSAPTNVLELSFLTAPTNISLTDNTLTWDAVTNAAKYSVYVNGQQVGDRVSPKYVFMNGVPAPGTTIFIVAKGNGITSFDSSKSNVFKVPIPTPAQ